MVERGSPTGVRTAPKPMEKQAMMTRLILVWRSNGMQFKSSTRRSEAMIAVIMLEDNPRMTTIRNTIIFIGITLVILLIAIWA